MIIVVLSLVGTKLVCRQDLSPSTEFYALEAPLLICVESLLDSQPEINHCPGVFRSVLPW